MTTVTLVWKNLTRNKLRTLLTIVAVFAGFTIFGVLHAFETSRTARAGSANADRVLVTNKINYLLPLPFAYVSRVRATPDVRVVSYSVWFGGRFRDSRNPLAVYAVDPATFLDAYPEYVLAEADRAAFLRNRDSMIVGEQVANRYKWKIGDRVPIGSTIFRRSDGSDTWRLTIAGVAKPRERRTDTNFAAFHYENLALSDPTQGGKIGWMIVRTADASRNASVARAIDSMFANSPHETLTMTEQAFVSAFTEQFGDISFVITAVTGAALVTILLIAGNTMMLAARERTREVAILRTIGFTPAAIATLVIGESLLLTLIGGLCGLAMAWMLVTLIAQRAVLFASMVLGGETVVAALIQIALLGVLASILPMLHATSVSVRRAFESG